jgi:hypothetical protein
MGLPVSKRTVTVDELAALLEAYGRDLQSTDEPLMVANRLLNLSEGIRLGRVTIR